MKKRIIQVLPVLAYGDAIGNDTMALMDIIAGMGYDTAIYAEGIDHRIKSRRVKKLYEDGDFPFADIVIYHLSTGSWLNEKVRFFGKKLIVIYHNITPSDFFDIYEPSIAESCRDGYRGLEYLKDKTDYVLADSEYNKEELLKSGYKCKIDVLPIVIPFSDYSKQADKKMLRIYNDDMTNILFVGRLAPNKCQEDIIASFYAYKSLYNRNCRLIFAGSPTGDLYYARLREYIKSLGVKDIVFTEHIPFSAILAFYKIADLFLCLSEHEGFCVPLVEAMFFCVPIVAYESSAVGETLDKGGILLREKDPIVVAGVMDRIIRDKTLRENIRLRQKERLNDLRYENIKKMFINYLERFMEGDLNG